MSSFCHGSPQICLVSSMYFPMLLLFLFVNDSGFHFVLIVVSLIKPCPCIHLPIYDRKLNQNMDTAGILKFCQKLMAQNRLIMQ